MLGSPCKGQMTSSSEHSAFGHEAHSVVFPMPRDAPPQCEPEQARGSQQSRLRVAIGQAGSGREWHLHRLHSATPGLAGMWKWGLIEPPAFLKGV